MADEHTILDRSGVDDVTAATIDDINGDDPVVREIEVYINRIANPSTSAEDVESSGASMYLLQYPLRPIYRPYGDQGRLVRIKHRSYQKTLQMHYTLNMESDNFDRSRRAELLENQFSGDNDQSKTAGVSHLLNSMPCVSPNSSYGLGLLQGDRLYVTPLTSVLQFRPDFTHVDDEEDRARKRAEGHLNVVAPETTQQDTMTPTSAKTPKKKSVKDEKKESDPLVAAAAATPQQQQAARHLIPNEAEWHRYPPSRVRDFLLNEPWDDVDSFFDPDSTETHEILQLLTSFEVPIPKESSDEKLANDEEAPIEEEDERIRYKRVAGGPSVPTINFSNDFQSYVDRLCSISGPETESTTPNALSASSGPLSFLSLSRLPIDQQVLRILQHRHVESFKRIKSLLTRDVPDEELVLHLRSYGEVILGNWVCKSALMYDGLVAHCRDLLLCLLAMEKPIHREKVKPYVGHLSMEKLSDLLKELAEYRNNAWHFKLPPDREFIARFPGPAKESQERFSKDAVKAFYEKITAISNAQKQTSSTTQSSTGKTTSGDTLGLIDAECLTKAMQEGLKSGGALQAQSLLPLVQQYLKQQATDLEPAAQRMVLTGAAQLTADDMELILPRTAEGVGCGYWALRKTGSPQIDRHRSVILSVFKKQTLNHSKENKKGVTRAAILAEFAARGVKFDLPDFTFRKLMKEFAVNQQGFWVFKDFIEVLIRACREPNQLVNWNDLLASVIKELLDQVIGTSVMTESLISGNR